MCSASCLCLSHADGSLQSDVVPDSLQAFDDGEARSSIHNNIFVDRSTGTPQVQVVDGKTQVATVLPEACAQYLLVEPGDSDDDAAADDDDDNNDDDEVAAAGGGGRVGDGRDSTNTFISSGLTEQTLCQLLDFLQHREACELVEITKAYADRARRIQHSIVSKVMGSPAQRETFDRYDHGMIDRGTAEARLIRAGGRPGTYLLRLKELYKKYVLSLCVQGGTFMHFLVEARDGANNFSFMYSWLISGLIGTISHAFRPSPHVAAACPSWRPMRVTC